MIRKLHLWADRYFYQPKFLDKILSFLLLPLSFLYSFFLCLKKFLAYKEDLAIKIISIGNLTLGGSSKTPLTKALYQHYEKDYKIFIILRGYKRKSSNLVEVCKDGKLLANLEDSGDEAYLHASYAKNVLVSADRKEAILKAKENGATLILLDDAFSKFKISKFDILVKPKIQPYFPFTLPSGAYRYPKFFYSFADLIIEEKNLLFHQEISQPTSRMLLVTAIAKPFRLAEFFPLSLAQEFFPDHYSFKKEELEELLKKYQASSLLVTRKDFVKVKDFALPLSIIELDLELQEEVYKKIDEYLRKTL